MEYRIIYNDIEVLTIVEHTETSITKTLQKAFVGELEEGIKFFQRKNIDYQIILETYNIVEEILFVVPISDYSDGTNFFNREIAVLTKQMDFSSRIMYSAMIINIDDGVSPEKHYTFDVNNNFLLNENTENEIGEFDYFYDLVMNQEVSLPNVIKTKILEMDSRKVFDSL